MDQITKQSSKTTVKMRDMKAEYKEMQEKVNIKETELNIARSQLKGSNDQNARF